MSASVISGVRINVVFFLLPGTEPGMGQRCGLLESPQMPPEHRSTFHRNLCSQVRREFTHAHPECFPRWQMYWEPPTPLLGVHTLPPAPHQESAPQPGTHSPKVTLWGCDWVQHRVLVPSAQEASSPLTGTSPRAPGKLPNREPHLDKRPENQAKPWLWARLPGPARSQSGWSPAQAPLPLPQPSYLPPPLCPHSHCPLPSSSSTKASPPPTAHPPHAVILAHGHPMPPASGSWLFHTHCH